MAFKNYNYGMWKKEIRDLLREILKVKDKIRFHEKKINYHEKRIETTKTNLLEIEKKLNEYLLRAGNKIDEKV